MVRERERERYLLLLVDVELGWSITNRIEADFFFFTEFFLCSLVSFSIRHVASLLFSFSVPSSGRRYLVLLGFSLISIHFDLVWFTFCLGFTGFYRVCWNTWLYYLFTSYYWVSLVLMYFHGSLVFLGFTGFYWVLWNLSSYDCS